MKTSNYSKVALDPVLANGIALFTACILALPTVALAEARKIPFTGTEIMLDTDMGSQFTDGVAGFISGWHFTTHEEMTDPRVSGQGTIGWNAILDFPSFTGPQWGTFHLENAGGSWDGYWQGTISAMDGHLVDRIVLTAVGHSGYEGLVARWTYEGQDWSAGNPLFATGYIIEAKGGPVDRPLLAKGSRIDQIQMVPGVFLNPASGEMIGAGALGRISIIEGNAQNSHAGLCVEQGCGILDPITGAITAMGTERAANGDLIYWVAEGGTQLSHDGQTAVFNGAVHFAGGTGRFDAVTGGFEGIFGETLEGTDNPLISLAKYSYRVYGTIRYN